MTTDVTSSPDEAPPGGCPFDHHAPMTIDQIWASYAELREARVVHSEHHGGFYVLSRFADVRAALRDPATFSSAGSVRIPDGGGRSIPIDVDPPTRATPPVGSPTCSRPTGRCRPPCARSRS